MICFPWERREMSLNSLSAYPTFPSFLSLAFVFRERMCTQTFIHFLNCRRCSFLPICWRCFVNLLYSEVLFIILYLCNLPCFMYYFRSLQRCGELNYGTIWEKYVTAHWSLWQQNLPPLPIKTLDKEPHTRKRTLQSWTISAFSCYSLPLSLKL